MDNTTEIIADDMNADGSSYSPARHFWGMQMRSFAFRAACLSWLMTAAGMA